MTFKKIQPGGIYYTVSKYKMGNTSIRSTAVHRVRVESVDAEKEIVTASWNHNPPRKYYRNEWSKWREKEPVLVKSGFLGQRLATREELKAMKAKGGTEG